MSDPEEFSNSLSHTDRPRTGDPFALFGQHDLLALRGEVCEICGVEGYDGVCPSCEAEGREHDLPTSMSPTRQIFKLDEPDEV